MERRGREEPGFGRESPARSPWSLLQKTVAWDLWKGLLGSLRRGEGPRPPGRGEGVDLSPTLGVYGVEES